MMKLLMMKKSSRGSLNDQITEKVNELLDKDKYGITVVDVRMKRTDLPEENEQSVYTRMISERESKAQEYLSRGDAEKNKIIAETDKTVQELLATAKADAETIRSEGEAEAAQVYNQSYAKSAEFYSLFRTLESYKENHQWRNRTRSAIRLSIHSLLNWEYKLTVME